MYTVIDGKLFKKMLIGSYQLMNEKCEIINQLNVFPVPDGDTGNNMLHTLRSMYSMIAEMNDSEPVGIIAEKASTGAIMGARGNSGVILSQIIHGISKGLHGKKTATCRQMSKAFQYGILYAYRAITTPIEGTILSVARGIAKGTRDVIREEPDFSKILIAAIHSGEEALAKTPTQLKILADANVVDAGGQGLIFFLMGCLNGLTGQITEINVTPVQPLIKRMEAKGESFSIEYPYCTEFIISPCKIGSKKVREALMSWGESMIVAEGDNLIKVHIHARNPGRVLDIASSWGILHDIKCDNMIDQFHKNKLKQEQHVKKELGILTVVSGKGWENIYRKLGCDIVSGGQSMNPSVQELSDAMENGQYDNYIILPNNKNIILAAKQLKKWVGDKIQIVESKDPMQGLAAAMAFSATNTIKDNVEEMTERMKEISTGVVTRAVRDSRLGETIIRKDDFMAMTPNHTVKTSRDLKTAFFNLLETLITDDMEIISVYYGEGLDSKSCQQFVDEATVVYPDVEFEMYEGNQPLYPLFISAE